MTIMHAPPQIRSRPPATRRRAPAVPRRFAFWLLALVLTVTMLGTTLPTPLYVIYQGRWHFSAAVVTVTFAVYAAAVIATLLLAGRSPDQAGRRPVLATALGASALSTVVFIVAPGVAALIAARIVSGLSAGLMTGTATAAPTELVPASAHRRASLAATAANMAGLGLGPLVAGLLAQYAPHPTTLVFEAYLAVLAVAGLIMLVLPETVPHRTRPALRFAGLGIPERGRGEFIAAGVAGFAAFALLVLFSSLVPGFPAGQLHQGSHAVRGAVVFLLFAVGTALFLAGTLTGGVAVGAIFLGSLATANRLAPAERRGHAIRVRGRLGRTMRAAFPGLRAAAYGADTLLTGALPDQAALHGVCWPRSKRWDWNCSRSAAWRAVNHPAV